MRRAFIVLFDLFQSAPCPRAHPVPTMYATWTRLAFASLFVLAVPSAHAAQSGAAETEMPQARTVPSAERTVLAHEEVTRLRYAAYFRDASERCRIYEGKARRICIDEAKMKFLQ